MGGISVSWFGNEVTGGSETVWDMLEKELGVEKVNFERIRPIIGCTYPYERLGFPEIDSAALIQEYIRMREIFTKDDFIIKNSMQLPTFKPKARTICLAQDCHKYGVERLGDMYQLSHKARIGELFDLFQRESIKNSDITVFVSPFAKAKIDVDVEDRVIEHGVDLDIFRPWPDNKAYFRKLWNVPDERPIGIYVGRYHPQKGMHIISELIKDTTKHWVLFLMGFIPQSFKDALPANVTLFNNVPRATMPAYYQAADFFILPAYCESFGLASLEAAACGMPLVTNKTGWLWERDTKALGVVLEETDNELNSYRYAIEKVLDGKFDPRSVAEEYPIQKWKSEWKKLIEGVI